MRKSVRVAFVLGVILPGSVIFWQTGRTIQVPAGPPATRSPSSAATSATSPRPGGDARSEIVHAADRLQALKRAADLGEWKTRIDLLSSLEADLIEGDPETTDAIRAAYFEAREGLQKGLWAILLAANLAEIERLASEWPKHLHREPDMFRTLLLYAMVRYAPTSCEEALSDDNHHLWERRFPAISSLVKRFLPREPFTPGTVMASPLGATTGSITISGIPTLHDLRSVYDPPVRKILLGSLEDSDRAVEDMAYRAIWLNAGDAALADEILRLAVDGGREDADRYLDMLSVKKTTDAGFKTLADFLWAHLEDESLVKQAIWILHAQRSERAEDLLVQLFHTTDKVELKLGVLAPHWPDKDSKLTQLAFSEARNPEWRIRCEALNHLGYLADNRDADEAVRNAAVADEIPGVRATCVGILARRSPATPEDLEILRRLASADPSPHVADAATGAVRKLSP